MKWYPYLYIGPQAEKKKNKILWKLRCNAGLVNVYLITLSSNGKDLFDIISSSYLKQKALRRNLPMIVGIAVGYEEALDLVIRIVEETIKNRGDANVKQYLKDQIKKEGL